jgi:fatty acid desaturase
MEGAMTRTQTEPIQALAAGRLWSVPRVGLDLIFWALTIVGAEAIGTWWAAALAVLWIGAGPMHDLLVHGHEGTHRHLARTRWVNEVFLWLTHALVGISGSAYRLFHFAHHRWAHTERDPEYQLLARVGKGAPGWTYLAIPAVAHAFVNMYPQRTGASARLRWRVAVELAGIALLHVGLAAGLGLPRYLVFVLAPIFTSLGAVVALRSVTEHHATTPGNRWTNTRTLNAGRRLDFLWSNTGYHLEHHLAPQVPFHRLPALRALLQDEMRARGSAIDDGFWHTAFTLLREPRHFHPERPRDLSHRGGDAFVDTGTLAFKMKVRWFRDLLAHPEARRHLWSLYYAGEAYVELHPDAVFIDRLEPGLATLLQRHLDDETRHAGVFRRLLAATGHTPAALPRTEDVGFYLLTEVLPEIGGELGRTSPFSREQVVRYMAFLHVLELRSLGDLHALIAACRARGEELLARQLTAILRDERFHASYTHTAVQRLARDRAEARAILDAIRRAERRHYRTCLVAILRRFEALGARPNDRAGAARWTLMRWVARLGLAVPLLPLFDTLPARLASE